MTRRGAFKEFRAEASTIIRSDLGGQVAQTFVNRVFMIGLGIASSIVIARALGPSGRGSYFLAVATAGLLVQFGNFGLHASNTYFVSREPSALPTLTGNTLAVSLGFTLAAAGMAYGLITVYPDLLIVRGWMLLLVLASMAVGLSYLLLQNLVLGIGDVRNFNLIEASQGALGLGLLWALITADLVSPQNVFATGILSAGLGAAWAYRRLHKHKTQPLRLSLPLYRQMFRYGVKAYLAAFASYLVIRSDVVVIGYLLDDAATGHYSIAVSLLDKVLILPMTVGTILFPKLVAMDPVDRWHLAKRSGQLIALVMVLLTGILLPLAHPLVRTLFGEPYLPAVSSFQILLPGAILISVNMIFMNYLAAGGMPPVTVVAPAIAAVVNILLNFWLIPQWGIEGAAFASSVAYALLLLVTCSYLLTQKQGVRDE